jgi:hypothetical protein
MGATHRYLVADLVTDRPLGYLPLSGVSYARRITAQGDFTGGFPIASPHLGELARLMADRPVSLYAERRTPSAASLWWGGIVWAAVPAATKRGQMARCDIVGATFDSLGEHRKLLSTLTYSDVDRGEVLAQLWDHMQADGPTAGAQVDVGAPVVGGDPWSGQWPDSSALWYSEAINEVVAVEPPFEWTIDVWADPDGTRHRKLRVGTPIIGNQTNQPLLIATPGTVQSWGQPSDQTTRPTHAVARGAPVATDLGGATVPMTSPVVVDADAVAAGAPRVDAVVDVETQDEQVLLDRAIGLLRPKYPIPSITVTLPDNHAFTPGNLGERGRAIVEGFMFDGGRLDTVRRIIGVQVTPAERGRAEQITFEFQTEEATS